MIWPWYRSIEQRPKEFLAVEGMTVTVYADLSELLINTGDKIYIPVEAVFAPEDKPLDTAENISD